MLLINVPRNSFVGFHLLVNVIVLHNFEDAFEWWRIIVLIVFTKLWQIKLVPRFLWRRYVNRWDGSTSPISVPTRWWFIWSKAKVHMLLTLIWVSPWSKSQIVEQAFYCMQTWLQLKTLRALYRLCNGTHVRVLKSVQNVILFLLATQRCNKMIRGSSS